jgi:hypothetical protein
MDVARVSGEDSPLAVTIRERGYAFVHRAEMRDSLAPFGSLTDWEIFRDSWNHLELDTFMADGGRYRRRRHAVYAAVAGGNIVRQPHQAHYQATDYNPLNGGVERWFEPVMPVVGATSSLSAVLAFCRALFDTLAPNTRGWRIEVHQFRIEARQGEQGQPTPEGLHRDGVDYVLALLVERHNIASGTTTVHALDGGQLGEFTLTDPLDAALLEDARVFHGVTPVQPIDPSRPSHRDVLVVTFASDSAAVRASA